MPDLTSLLRLSFLLLSLLLCLLIFLLLATACRRPQPASRWAPLHETSRIDPGSSFSALRFEVGIARQVNSHSQDLCLTRQPIDVFFHQNFQPRNDRVIAVHFKDNERVLLTSSSLVTRPDYVPTAPGRVFLDYGRLDLVSPDLDLYFPEDESGLHGSEESIDCRLSSQLEDESLIEEEEELEDESLLEEEEEEEEEEDEDATTRWSAWRQRLRFLVSDLCELIDVFLGLIHDLLELIRDFLGHYKPSHIHISWLLSASLSACLVIAFIGGRWLLQSSTTTSPSSPPSSSASASCGQTSGNDTKTTQHMTQPVEAIHHLHGILTSWTEIPQVLLAVDDVNNAALDYEVESTIYRDADHIIADLCRALDSITKPVGDDDDTYYHRQNLCVVARYHADQASLFWARIYAAYTEHETKPLDTAASYIKLVAAQLRELSTQETSPEIEFLVTGPNDEEKGRRERRAWMDISSLATPWFSSWEGDQETMKMVIHGANIKAVPHRKEEEDADLHDDEMFMYQLWETVIERGRLTGEREAGESAYFADDCTITHDDGFQHPACWLLTHNGDDADEVKKKTENTRTPDALTAVLHKSLSLLQDHIQHHLSSSSSSSSSSFSSSFDKVLTRRQISAFDLAKWGNPVRLDRPGSETLLLATLRLSWSVHAAALELVHFTDSIIQRQQHQMEKIPWQARSSIWDPRPKADSRQEAKKRHEMQQGPPIPALESLRELVVQKIAPISQRGVEVGVMLAGIHQRTKFVGEQIRELGALKREGGGGWYEWNFTQRLMMSSFGPHDGRSINKAINLKLIHRTIPPLPEQASLLENTASAMNQVMQNVAHVLQKRRNKVGETTQSTDAREGGGRLSSWMNRYILQRPATTTDDHNHKNNEDGVPVRQVQTAAAGGYYTYWWRLPSPPHALSEDLHRLLHDSNDGNEFEEEDNFYGTDPTDNWNEESPPWGSRTPSDPDGMDESIDYYELLGIKETASQQEIRKASWGLILKFHPDKKRTTAGHGQQQIEWDKFNTARAVLGDPEARKKYDLKRKAARHFS